MVCFPISLEYKKLCLFTVPVVAEWFEKIFENLLGHAGVRSKNENVRGTTFKVELHYYVHG